MLALQECHNLIQINPFLGDLDLGLSLPAYASWTVVFTVTAPGPTVVVIILQYVPTGKPRSTATQPFTWVLKHRKYPEAQLFYN